MPRRLQPIRPATGRELAGLALALAVAYVVVARLSILLAYEQTNVSPVWPASGIAFAALLIWGPRLAPGIMLGAFTANLWGFMDSGALPGTTAATVSLAMGVGNMLEALAGWGLWSRWVAPRRLLDHPGGVTRFLAVAAVMCVVAASTGTSALWAGGAIGSAQLSTVWSTWWLGDLGGVLVVTPLALAIAGGRRPYPVPGTRIEATALGAIIVALAGAAFLGPDPIVRVGPFLLWPLVLWSAMRFEARATTLVVAAITLASVLATVRGLGTFAGLPLQTALVTLQVYVGAVAVSALLVQAGVRHGAGRHV